MKITPAVITPSMALGSAKAGGKELQPPVTDEKALSEAQEAAFQALVQAKERELGRPVDDSERAVIAIKLKVIVTRSHALERDMGRPLTASEVAEITAKIDGVERAMGRPLTDAEWADLAIPPQSQMDKLRSRPDPREAEKRLRQIEEIQAALRRQDQWGTLARILNPIAIAGAGVVTGGAGAALFYAIAEAAKKGP